MPAIKFSKEEVLSAGKLDAGWYKLKIVNVIEKTAKDGESLNWEVSFQVSEGPNAGVTFKDWQSEKPMGMKKRIEMIKALAGGKIEVGKDYGDLETLIGKEVMGYCTYDPDFKANKVDDFRTAKV